MKFFIVGTGRCGTGLVRQLLNLHESVYVPPESHWIPKMYQHFGMSSQPLRLFFEVIDRSYHAKGGCFMDGFLVEARLSKEALSNLVARELGYPLQTNLVAFNQALYKIVAGRNQKKLCGDKTPCYGLYMGLLQRLWPQARFLHVVRKGEDVARSMSRHSGFRRMVSHGIYDWCFLSFDAYFQKFPERDLPLANFMRLWEWRLAAIRREAEKLLPEHYLEIQYEELLAYPRKVLDQVAGFLSLPSSPSWIEAGEGWIQSSKPPFQEVLRTESDIAPVLS